MPVLGAVCLVHAALPGSIPGGVGASLAPPRLAGLGVLWGVGASLAPPRLAGLRVFWGLGASLAGSGFSGRSGCAPAFSCLLGT